MTPVPDTASVDLPEPLSPSPSTDGSSVVSRTPVPMSLSPPRPTPQQQQLPQHSTPVPGSPAPSSVATERSPAITPTQQRIDVLSPAETGVVLGLQQLERQQDEAERRRREEEEKQRRREQQLAAQQAQQQSTTSTPQQPRQQQQHTPHVHASPITVRYLDDDTAPSSTLESATRDAASHTTGDGSLGSGDDSSAQQQGEYKESNKFGRMIKKTKKRLSSNDFLRRRSSGDDLDDPANEDEEEGAVDALIYGHLQKLGRNGKWQTRWFESDGECLSYYKTSKRSKLLATLDLEKVGAIVVNEDDPKGCSFTIQVLGRPYYLRAESRAACKDWVITLNRVKEAKLQQGNVKLIHLRKHILFRSPPDLLTGEEAAFNQGIAIEKPHRPRTRAVDESSMENIEQMMHQSEVETTEPNAAGAAYYHQTDDTESLSQVVLAKWQKRRTSMNQLASKLAKWARSLKKYRCAESEVDTGARLDRHVHPPGHDNMIKNATNPVLDHEVVPPPKDAAVSGWIGKETSLAAKAGPVVLDPDEALEALDVVENIETQVKSDPIPHTVTSVGSPMAPEIEVEETRELS